MARVPSTTLCRPRARVRVQDEIDRQLARAACSASSNTPRSCWPTLDDDLVMVAPGDLAKRLAELQVFAEPVGQVLGEHHAADRRANSVRDWRKRSRSSLACEPCRLISASRRCASSPVDWKRLASDCHLSMSCRPRRSACAGLRPPASRSTRRLPRVALLTITRSILPGVSAATTRLPVRLDDAIALHAQRPRDQQPQRKQQERNADGRRQPHPPPARHMPRARVTGVRTRRKGTSR